MRRPVFIRYYSDRPLFTNFMGILATISAKPLKPLQTSHDLANQAQLQTLTPQYVGPFLHLFRVQLVRTPTIRESSRTGAAPGS